MKLTPSPFAPAAFADLPTVAGLRAATASRGFYAAAGLERDDVFLIAFDEGTNCAGVFTRSATASHDVKWCRTALSQGGGRASALLVNSGNSNAFTGAHGGLKNEASLGALVSTLRIAKDTCFLAATGVIGQPLPDPNYVAEMVPALADGLGKPDWEALARAFMTTDTYPKGAGTRMEIDGQPVGVAGIAKGSGMIAPNMATMLAYIITDAAVSAPILDHIIGDICAASFNAITVDGDTSTSDTFMIFATAAAGHTPIRTLNDERLPALKTALHQVAHDLAIAVVKDGEGASKFVTVHVEGAQSDASARVMAADVANSPLVK
ncbi:MAG: bifunctional ornithine acetyltransferase/N-acetylglutamate synthase, partial [Pseudomonadota bacterium]